MTEADKQTGGKVRRSPPFVLCVALNANYTPLNWFKSVLILSIINMVNNRAEKFESNELREVLQPLFSSDYALTSQDLMNSRIWCEKHSELVRKKEHAVTFNPSSIGTFLRQWSFKSSPVSMEDAVGISSCTGPSKSLYLLKTQVTMNPDQCKLD